MMPAQLDLSWLLNRPPVPDNRTFEIALVMGGTVSAGAYTAGAIDFLIQALDCREQAIANNDPNAPTHNVVLKVVTGTSGGGVIAGTMARALAYDFPYVSHITLETNPAAAQLNPFYKVWTNILRLEGFLKTDDIEAGKFASLLNPTPIDDAAKYLAGYTVTNLKSRRYIASPLRVIVTITNLSGIPFKTDFGDNLSQTYINHADYAKFAVGFPKPDPRDPKNLVEWTVLPYPDEFGLSYSGASVPNAIDWTGFSEFAVATAAFPLGFPARPLKRPADHYLYRVVSVPQPGPATPQYVALTPDWDMLKLTPGTAAIYSLLSVDGGATDNEPIELARTALSGYLQRSPRDGTVANRAVLLIDPFAGEADLGPTSTETSILKIAGGLLNGLTQQTRYDTADLLLAADPDIYSRFMLTASRNNGAQLGAAAIASSGLDAFIGFACPEFSKHDFILGRKNCQDFLKNVFVLDKSNPIMQAGWTAAQIAQHQLQAAEDLPIIPLLGTAAVAEAVMDWPAGALNPANYHDQIAARAVAILRYAGDQEGTLLGLAALLAGGPAGSQLANLVVSAMNDYLTSASLAAPANQAPVQAQGQGPHVRN